MKTVFLTLSVLAAVATAAFGQLERYSPYGPAGGTYLVVTREGDAFRAALEPWSSSEYLYARLPGGPSCILATNHISRIEAVSNGSDKIVTKNPVVRIPALGQDIYVFGGSYYGGTGAIGYASLVEGLAASDRADQSLQEYAREYRGKTLTASVSNGIGITLSLTGLVYAYGGMLYYSGRSMDREAGLSFVFGNVIYIMGTALGIAAERYAGPPRGVVNYYNETHPLSQRSD